MFEETLHAEYRQQEKAKTALVLAMAISVLIIELIAWRLRKKARFEGVALGVCLSIRNSPVSTTRNCGSDQSRPQHVT
jgi:hypothetical protein